MAQQNLSTLFATRVRFVLRYFPNFSGNMLTSRVKRLNLTFGTWTVRYSLKMVLIIALNLPCFFV